MKIKSFYLRVVEEVAKHLGNTPAVCRACYSHPAVFEAHVDGSLPRKLAQGQRRRLRGLTLYELGVLGLLEAAQDWRQQLAESARRATYDAAA